GSGAADRNLEEVRKQVTVIEANLAETDAWFDALEPGSLILHAAAKNTHQWCNLHPEEDEAINYRPQVALFDALQRRGKNVPPLRMLLMSTRTVYGGASDMLTE